MTETYEQSSSATGSGRRRNWQHGGQDHDTSWDREGRASDRLRGFANRQKDIGVEKMSGLADAAHKAADALANENSGMADLVHEAADGLHRASENLRTRDVGDIYRSVNDFARQQPLTFLACSFAAGVLLSRFLKSSSSEGRQHPEEHQYHPSPNL
ncbi:MAG TPA: hypothetical protein VNZ93_10825 [Pseudorhodoplanes sp.]|nr:hypothetical protein [Pseudorhodoplanes sp.]